MGTGGDEQESDGALVALDCYELCLRGRRGNWLRAGASVLATALAFTDDFTLADVVVRDRATGRVVGVTAAGRGASAASAHLELLLERAAELSPADFLARYLDP